PRRRCAGRPVRATEARRALLQSSAWHKSRRWGVRLSGDRPRRHRCGLRMRALTFPSASVRRPPAGPTAHPSRSMDLPFSKKFRQRHPQLTRVLAVGATFLVSFVVGLAFSGWALVCRAGACPSVDVLDQYQPRQTSKLYAADGRFIAELGLERRTLLKIDQIPPLVRNAFVMTEDKRFYQHSGVDWYRVPGALLTDIRRRSFAEGFSTITMQLARNIFPERLTRDKS